MNILLSDGVTLTVTAEEVLSSKLLRELQETAADGAAAPRVPLPSAAIQSWRDACEEMEIQDAVVAAEVRTPIEHSAQSSQAWG